MTTPPVPATWPHVQALRTALAGIDPAPAVYVGGAPPAPAVLPDRYLVLYPDPGQALSESLADERTDWSGMVQITCVARIPDAAVWLADRVRRALAVPLTVAGRAAWRPEELGGPPLQRDDDETPPLFYLPVQYRLRSTPA